MFCVFVKIKDKTKILLKNLEDFRKIKEIVLNKFIDKINLF